MQQIQAQVKSNDKSIPKWIDQAVDLIEIANRLQALGTADCQYCSNDIVQYAFSKWFASMINSIEEDPEWFIQKFQPDKFHNHLPCLDELDGNDSDDLVPPENFSKSSLLIC